MIKNTFIFLLLLTSSALAEIVPATRFPPAGTWANAGVEGGIPERATIFANVTDAPYNADPTGVTDSAAAINSALGDCPTGQTVFVPAGTYRVDSLVDIDDDITIRGAGMGQTIIDCGAAAWFRCLASGPGTPFKTSDPRTVTAGATAGSTTVTLSDATSFLVGYLIGIDTPDTDGPPDGDPNNFVVWTRNQGDTVGLRHRGSMHIITSVDGNDITFKPALPCAYASAQAFRTSNGAPAKNVGIESMSFDMTDSTQTQAVQFQFAHNCWVKDVEVYGHGKRCLWFSSCAHMEIRGCYLHDQSNGGSNSEGIDLERAVSWSLIEDNICVAMGFPSINMGDSGSGSSVTGCTGNVIAYNYVVDSFFTDPPGDPGHGLMAADIGCHSPHNFFNLFEGNWCGKFGFDAWHGSSSHNTLLRNVATGQPTQWTNANHRQAISIDRANYYYNLVGNVFGDSTNVADWYDVDDDGVGFWASSERTIFRLGWPNMGNQNASYSLTWPSTNLYNNASEPGITSGPDGHSGPIDLYAKRDDTTNGNQIIEGNWDAVNNAQTWTITPETIPNSYYLAAKPSFFGALSWPPVNPAAAQTTDPTVIPAAYRHLTGPPPAVGASATVSGAFTAGVPVSLPAGYAWRFEANQNIYSDLSQTPAVLGDTIAEWAPAEGAVASFLQGGATNKCEYVRACEFLSYCRGVTSEVALMTAVGGATRNSVSNRLEITNSAGGGAGGAEQKVWLPRGSYVLWFQAHSDTTIATSRVKVGSTTGSNDILDQQVQADDTYHSVEFSTPADGNYFVGWWTDTATASSKAVFDEMILEKAVGSGQKYAIRTAKDARRGLLASSKMEAALTISGSAGTSLIVARCNNTVHRGSDGGIWGSDTGLLCDFFGSQRIRPQTPWNEWFRFKHSATGGSYVDTDYTFGSATKFSCFVFQWRSGGTEHRVITDGVASPWKSNTTFSNFSKLYLGGGGGGTEYNYSDIAAHVHWSSVLSDSDVADINSWCSREYGTAPNVVPVAVIGDSLSRVMNQFNSSLFSWAQFVNLKRGHAYSVWAGRAQSSEQLGTHELPKTDFAILKSLSNQGGKVVIIKGINDIGNGRTAVQLEADVNNLLDLDASSDHIDTNVVDVIVCTVPPSATFNASMNTEKNNFNAAILARHGVDLTVVDIHALLATGDALKAEYDSGDGVHWNDVGNEAVANLLFGP